MIRGILIELGERELCDGSGAICAVVEITAESARALAPCLYKGVTILAPEVSEECADPSRPTGGCSLACG